METTYEEHFIRNQKTRWWGVGRRHMIANLLRGTSKEAKILDVGCSSGTLLSDLRDLGFRDLSGIDISQTAIDHCKKSGFKNIKKTDGRNLGNPCEKFDVIIASDVLEHIEEDLSTLQNWKSHLSDNGKLIVFVPAFQYLWSEHDARNRHFRRYTRRQIRQVLNEANMECIRTSYWNCALSLFAFFERTISRLFAHTSIYSKDEVYETPSFVNACLSLLLKCENRLLQHTNLPVGVSVFAIAEQTRKAEQQA